MPVFSKSLNLAQTGPSWTLDGVTRVSCTIHPQFELHLFDVAMAEVWADGYVDLGGSLSCGGADANGKARLNGATVRINIGTMKEWPIEKARERAAELHLRAAGRQERDVRSDRRLQARSSTKCEPGLVLRRGRDSARSEQGL